MKKFLLIISVALMLFGCAEAGNQPSGYRQISMDEAVEMMAQEPDCLILDVRRPDEFAAGHIPNAMNVPNESIGSSDIPELPDKERLIMVYCRSGRRSKEAAEKLVKLGYTNVVEFGGFFGLEGCNRYRKSGVVLLRKYSARESSRKPTKRFCNHIQNKSLVD